MSGGEQKAEQADGTAGGKEIEKGETGEGWRREIKDKEGDKKGCNC